MCSHNECLFDVGRLGRTGHKAPEFSGMFVGYTLVSIVYGIDQLARFTPTRCSSVFGLKRARASGGSSDWHDANAVGRVLDYDGFAGYNQKGRCV